MSSAELPAGGGFLEELVGFVAAGLGVGEDGGEAGPAGVGQDPLRVFGNGGACVTGQGATGLLRGAAGFKCGEKRRERVVRCPNTDFHRWKDLLKAAGVRDGRLHDARHTAATVLLILGISDAVVDSIMGWEPGKSARMRRRYQHMTGPVLQQTAAKIGALLWAVPADAAEEVGSRAAVRSGPASVDSAVYLADLGGRRLAFAAREHVEQVIAQWSEDRPGQAAQVEEIGREHWEAEAGGGAQLIRHEVPDRRMVHHAHAVFLAGGERLNVGRPARWSTWAWDFEPDLYTDLPVRWHTSRRPGQEIEAHVRGTDENAVSSAHGEACAQAVDRARNPATYGDGQS